MKKNGFKLIVPIILLLSVFLFIFSRELRFQRQPGQIEVLSSSISMRAEDKTAFAAEMDSIYQVALSTGSVQSASEDQINALIEAHIFSAGAERTQLEKDLAQYGIYVFTTQADAQPHGDVTLSAPMLYYLASENQWLMACGGYWNHDNLKQQILPGEVGEKDTFGIRFTDTGTYESSVVRAYGRISDAAQANSKSTSNRSDGDGAKGFSFQLQDEMIIGTKLKTQYVGYRWFGACTYDAGFSSFDAAATAYYVHTSDNCEITLE